MEEAGKNNKIFPASQLLIMNNFYYIRYTMKKEIIDFIKNSIKDYNYKGAVIGISGGIDSAVVGTLLVEALGPENVFGLLLPERDSAKSTIRESKLVCRHLGIEYKLIRLTGILRKKGIYRLQPPAFIFPRKIQERYTRNIWLKGGEDTYLKDLATEGDRKFLAGLAYYRIKHRTRMTMLYFEAEKRQYAVVGCTNKTELKTGFYVKWGDDSVDIEPILHLYKTQVYALAKELGIPDEIMKKPPSPDIAPGITDEFALGYPYNDVDRILEKIEKGEDTGNENPGAVKRIKEILHYADYRNVRQLQI